MICRHSSRQDTASRKLESFTMLMKNNLQKISQLAMMTAIIWLIGASWLGCQANNSCETAKQKMASNNLVPEGVPLFVKVSEGLYRGGQPSEHGFAELRKIGIRTVVSLRAFNPDRKLLAGMGFRQFHISCKTIHPEEEDVMEFLQIVTDPLNQPVFVHCRDGTDRTGMMVAVYRMVVQNWSRQEALEEMKALGFNKIWGSLENYIKELNTKKIKTKLAHLQSISNVKQ